MAELPPLQHPQMIAAKTYRLRRPVHLGRGEVTATGSELVTLCLDVNREYTVIGETVRVPVLDVYGALGEVGSVHWLNINDVIPAMRRDKMAPLTPEGNLIPSPQSFGGNVERAWTIFHQRRVAEAMRAAKESDKSNE